MAGNRFAVDTCAFFYPTSWTVTKIQVLFTGRAAQAPKIASEVSGRLVILASLMHHFFSLIFVSFYDLHERFRIPKSKYSYRNS